MITKRFYDVQDIISFFFKKFSFYFSTTDISWPEIGWRLKWRKVITKSLLCFWTAATNRQLEIYISICSGKEITKKILDLLVWILSRKTFWTLEERVWVVQPLREGGRLASLRMFVLLKIFLLLILTVYLCQKFPFLATLSRRLADFFREDFSWKSRFCKIA